MDRGWLLVVYCLLIMVASLAGGWLPLLFRLSHTGMQLSMSFVGGAMIGVGRHRQRSAQRGGNNDQNLNVSKKRSHPMLSFDVK